MTGNQRYYNYHLFPVSPDCKLAAILNVAKWQSSNRNIVKIHCSPGGHRSGIPSIFFHEVTTLT